MFQHTEIGEEEVIGKEHWVMNEGSRLFLWEKALDHGGEGLGSILFVHGSSMASQPTFDLNVAGRPYSSAMNWFALNGFDTWCLDVEGYGRSDKTKDSNFDISSGANDLSVAANYICDLKKIEKVHVYGISSGALRAGLFAERQPERVSRLALDAMVWTGEGSPTLIERRKKIDQFKATNRRPINYEFVRSIFMRDHPGTTDEKVIDAFSEYVCSLDDSIPNGTYVDMCENLPIVYPLNLTMPVLVMRGEWDGIASVDDLLNFFRLLPNPDKQFKSMHGISHGSFQQKNYLMVYRMLYDFFTQPEPVYVG